MLRGHPSDCIGSWTRKSSVDSGCAAEVLRLQLRGHLSVSGDTLLRDGLPRPTVLGTNQQVQSLSQ